MLVLKRLLKTSQTSQTSQIFKRSFSCNYNNYNKPLLFGPMFSSFFFGTISTYILLGNIISSHNILKKELDDIKKEMKEKK